MALTFTVANNINPATGLRQYFPMRKGTNPISFHRLCEEVSHSCSLTRADVTAVLIATIDIMKHHLANSESVELGEMGTIFTSFRTTCEDSPEKVSAKNIVGVALNCKFKPEFKEYFQPTAGNVIIRRFRF